MRLTPWEEERLLIFSAAELARRHRDAGLALNAPEAIAVMCDAMLEAARAGASYADVAGLAHGAPSVSALFVSASADQAALRRRLDTGREVITVAGCRGLTRASLLRNRATAAVEVDPVDGRVSLAGRPLAAEPLTEVPLSRRYFLR